MSKISFSFQPLVPKESMNICYLYEMHEVDLLVLPFDGFWDWKLTNARIFFLFFTGLFYTRNYYIRGINLLD